MMTLSWKNLIFTKFILVFLLIMMPICFIGAQIYSWGIRTVGERISDLLKSEAKYYLNNLETELKNIRVLEYSTLNDINLLQLAQIPGFMSNYEKTNAVQQLQSRLEAIQFSSAYIHRVRVHIPAFDRTVIAGGSISNLPEERIEYLKNSLINEKEEINFYQGEIALVLANTDYMDIETVPQFIIDIQLSEAAIKQSLLLFNENGSGTLLILPFKEIIAVNEQEEEVANTIIEAISKNDNTENTISMEISGKRYLVVCVSSTNNNMKLVKFIPEENVFSPIRRYKAGFLTFSVIAGLIIVILLFSTYKLIHKPLLKLVNAFNKVENGEFRIQIQHKHNDEFRYLYSRFNAMVESIQTLINQVYKQKILKQHSELKQLQSQINPHFQYNCYNIVCNLALAEDYETLQHFTRLLGKYLQYITRTAEDDVDLESEIKHARVYAEIQARRFRNRIQIFFDDLPENLKSIKVPRLIIQPIIENAFEHGLANKQENGIIKVAYLMLPGKVEIIIEDNGEELSNDKLDSLRNSLETWDEYMETTGIINAHRRIILKIGEKSGISVCRSEMGGLKVCIVIGLTEGDEYVQTINC